MRMSVPLSLDGLNADIDGSSGGILVNKLTEENKKNPQNITVVFLLSQEAAFF